MKTVKEGLEAADGEVTEGEEGKIVGKEGEAKEATLETLVKGELEEEGESWGDRVGEHGEEFFLIEVGGSDRTGLKKTWSLYQKKIPGLERFSP